MFLNQTNCCFFYIDYQMTLSEAKSFCIWSFFHGSIVNKAAVCLEKKQGNLVRAEVGFWYNKVGSFLELVGIRERNFVHWWTNQTGQSNQPHPECKVNGTEWYGGWVWVIHFVQNSVKQTQMKTVTASGFTEDFVEQVKSSSRILSKLTCCERMIDIE